MEALQASGVGVPALQTRPALDLAERYDLRAYLLLSNEREGNRAPAFMAVCRYAELCGLSADETIELHCVLRLGHASMVEWQQARQGEAR